MTDDELPMKEYRRAGLEITRGNPEVYKSLWSRRDDTVIAPELAYTVEIERIRTRVGGSDELTPIAIRDDRLPARGRRLEGDAPPRRPDQVDATGGISAAGVGEAPKRPREAFP